MQSSASGIRGPSVPTLTSSNASYGGTGTFESSPTSEGVSSDGRRPKTIMSWAKRRGKDPDADSEMDPDGVSSISRGASSARPSPTSGRNPTLPRGGEPPRPLPAFQNTSSPLANAPVSAAQGGNSWPEILYGSAARSAAASASGPVFHSSGTWKLGQLSEEVDLTQGGSGRGLGGAFAYSAASLNDADDDGDTLKPRPVPQYDYKGGLIMPTTVSGFHSWCWHFDADRLLRFAQLWGSRFLQAAPKALQKFAFVLIIAGVLWIPGIIGLIATHTLDHPSVAEVGLGWWSIWMSSIWLSWFVCRSASRVGPNLLKNTVGFISLQARHWIAYISSIQFYIAFFVWTMVVWITWLTLIWGHFQNPKQAVLSPVSSNSSAAIVTASDSSDVASEANSMIAASRFLMGLVIVSAMLMLEKLAIQVIAYNFHQVSYASRIADCKFHLKVLVQLYSHSKRDLKEEGTDLEAEHIVDLDGSHLGGTRGSPNSFDFSQRLRNHRKQGYPGLHGLAEQLHFTGQKSPNNALAAAAQDMTVNALRLPNSGERVVLSALSSIEQTRHLSRRIFYSFARRDKTDRLVVRYVDFATALGEQRWAMEAWTVFDRDENGDVLAEEMEAACMAIRKERLSVINSVRDVDSAVGTLDHMFMSCYTVISCTIIAALLSVKFSNLIASFGTVILGLSWLISGGAQELLQAIVFLFIKHPYDVGDVVNIIDLKQEYVVEEMKLLSTIFRTTNGEFFQIGNAKLASGNGIINQRRSGPTIEKFVFTVSYATTYQQLENLRAKMLLWLVEQGRDFLPGLDLQILDLKAQESMQLNVGIRYKSNCQDYDLKAQRRNRWLCKFKQTLAELQILGADSSAQAADAWKTMKGEAAKEAVRGGVDREYMLMDKREEYDSASA